MLLGFIKKWNLLLLFEVKNSKVFDLYSYFHSFGSKYFVTLLHEKDVGCNVACVGVDGSQGAG